MAIKNNELGGTDWIDGEVLYSEDLNDTFDEAKTFSTEMLELNNFGKVTDKNNILAFSSTKWQSPSHTTTDAGATYSLGGYGASHSAVVCKENRTKAIAWEDITSFKYTTDSGDTWTATTTQPANATDIRGVDYTVDGVIYIAGIRDAGGIGLWYSTDDGANFTQVSGGTDTFIGVGMHDTTHGLAIKSDGYIWYTTNGTSWTNTGHSLNNPSSIEREEVVVISSGANITDFEALLGLRDSSGNDYVGYVEKYDGTGNSSFVLYPNTATDTFTSNLIKLTNGNICYVTCSTNRSDERWWPSGGELYVTKDNGTNWFLIPLGNFGYYSGSYDEALFATGDSITEYDTNKILIATRIYKLYKINLN